MQIDITKLQMVAYVGAGNRTPVVDISGAIPREDLLLSAAQVRQMLESHKAFRLWLEKEGKKLRADTVMIYYPAVNQEYDFVTFVGEPNAGLCAPFSDMCGNGIRCLGLHLLLSETRKRVRKQYEQYGIKVMAGDTKKIRFAEFNRAAQTADVAVDMGTFQSDIHHLTPYVHLWDRTPGALNSVTLPDAFVPAFLQGKVCGIGFNGGTEGEPHLVFLYKKEAFLDLAKKYHFSNIDSEASLHRAVRQIVCEIGSNLTFNLSLFPKGINVNLGVVVNKVIYMATHERNLLPSRTLCLAQQRDRIFCQCNTMACGTGGAVLANIAKLQGFTEDNVIQTAHPGGTIKYYIQDTTIMIGPAAKLSGYRCLNKVSEVQ